MFFSRRFRNHSLLVVGGKTTKLDDHLENNKAGYLCMCYTVNIMSQWSQRDQPGVILKANIEAVARPSYCWKAQMTDHVEDN